jgi:hypothetical protein
MSPIPKPTARERWCPVEATARWNLVVIGRERRPRQSALDRWEALARDGRLTNRIADMAARRKPGIPREDRHAASSIKRRARRLVRLKDGRPSSATRAPASGLLRRKVFSATSPNGGSCVRVFLPMPRGYSSPDVEQHSGVAPRPSYLHWRSTFRLAPTLAGGISRRSADKP